MHDSRSRLAIDMQLTTSNDGVMPFKPTRDVQKSFHLSYISRNSVKTLSALSQTASRARQASRRAKDFDFTTNILDFYI